MVSSSLFTTMVVMLSISSLACLLKSVSSNFSEEFDVTWGDDRAKILNNGEALTLSLDKNSGSGFQSKNEYLFGKFDIQLKLVPGNSAGTVSTYYLSSQGLNHDEIDFEFLGNLSGDPYIVHTNIYSQGKGDREQQFYLWFDPTKDFHTYSILWNPLHIVFYVDDVPLREFKNSEAVGVPYLNKQPMRVYSSLWDAEDWATRGGLIKTDWTQAPFIASFQNFKSNACIQSSASSSPSPCSSLNSSTSSSSTPNTTWLYQELDLKGKKRLRRVQKKVMIYNYCTDSKRFPRGAPPECSKKSTKS